MPPWLLAHWQAQYGMDARRVEAARAALVEPECCDESGDRVVSRTAGRRQSFRCSMCSRGCWCSICARHWGIRRPRLWPRGAQGGSV